MPTFKNKNSLAVFCNHPESDVHRHTGRGGGGWAGGAAAPPKKFWATKIFWAAREIWAKPGLKDVLKLFFFAYRVRCLISIFT